MGACKGITDSNLRIKKTKGDKNADDNEWPDSWPLIPVMDGIAGRKVILPECKNLKSSSNFKCIFLEFHSYLPDYDKTRKIFS